MELAQLMARKLLISEPGSQDEPAADDPDSVNALLAAAGLIAEGPSSQQQLWESAEEFWVLPDNLPVLELWRAVQTQWRTGPAGATGLDYLGVEACIRMTARGSRRRRAEWFRGLQVMERATLEEWAEARAIEAAEKRGSG